mmetsp:Transcript_142168/g.247764  ORF Transcript_142168/g.247764 Transcript_142168/m.247764 type:complete len:267 (-) Transcript_142168:37-837(-)
MAAARRDPRCISFLWQGRKHLLRVMACCLFTTLQRATSSPVCDLGVAAPLAIGDPVMFCVFLSTNPPKKMIFRVKLEEYASLVLDGSDKLVLGTQGQGNAAGKAIHTWIASTAQEPAGPLDCTSDMDFQARGHFVSCPQVYASDTHVAKLLNLVVNVRDGSISSFAWDNSCSACGPSRCMESSMQLNAATMLPGSAVFDEGTCGETHVKCAPEDVACNLQIIVTWAGTDKYGQNLQSAGRRLSRFSGATLQSLYETLDHYKGEATG